jgi:hypothetical protein
MTEEGEDQPANSVTNIERLQGHLKEDTLASRLVETYAASSGSLEDVKSVLADRLDKVRRDLDQN